MIAEPLDLDLQQCTPCPLDGPSAAKIENSFIVAWIEPGDPGILMGLAWAYRDVGYEYAAKEAMFLWELARL